MTDLLISIFLVYLILSLILTAGLIIRMYVVNYKTNGVKIGKSRIKELMAQGRWRQMPIYSMEAIREKKALGTVRLSFFPNPSGQTSKYVIICPGGGYAHCVLDAEGYAVAAKVNELGYAAFVLEYRTGLNCSEYAPMEDLATAIKHIEENKELYRVETKDYAICGFSAGGNLAGMFGTEEYGYKKYGIEKPGALFLGYPWTNVNHWLDHPYWNIWIVFIGIWLTERGNFYMFGLRQTHKERESLCVQKWITDTYPKTYMFAGSQDILVPASLHGDVMAEALEKNHVNYQYRKFFRMPHGIGLGLHTKAEGWLEQAIAFWQETEINTK